MIITTCRLIADSRLGNLIPSAGPCPRFDFETEQVAKGTKVILISKPVFAVDNREQTIQIVKVRFQIGPVILRDTWLPFGKLEFV